MNIMNFIKSNIKPIIIITIISIFSAVISIRVYILKKENDSLKEKIEQKSQAIEVLNANISKLEAIIEDNKKQKEIEDKLLKEKQEEQKKLEEQKSCLINDLDNLMETNNEVKDWCEQPIPSDISTLFILGLR